MAKIKTGKVEIPDEDFKDQNITAHISIRLPLDLVKSLKKISLTEEYEGRYQVLMRDILSQYVQQQKGKKRTAG
jgi:metal-responsive CopG/Arc/MetJ family transcriptional regulator